MLYLNEVNLIGNVTRDPELKALPSGTNVCSFSIATNRVWKDAQGQKQEDVQFHNCVAFGKTADTIAQYVKKGKQLYVKGRIQNRSWDDATTGEKKYRTEIMVENFQFGSDPSGEGQPQATQRATKPASKPARAPAPDLDPIDYGDANYDDIPF